MLSGNAHHQLVVIGASAGGIEALSALVATLPSPFPAPIVIAQHLDPTRESRLEVILARRSTLPVRTATNGERMDAGVIYVVPSNQHVAILDGFITLQSDAGDGAVPSVDRLLTTAAASYGENLVAVILSGTGSDGTAGARAVKQAGGTVIIQDPATASFGGMPASLAPTTVDITARLERIGSIVHEVLMGAYTAPVAEDDTTMRGLLDDVRGRSGIDFNSYKPATIQRRLQRRIADTSTRDIKGYSQYLRAHPEEYQRLINTFLIKVTEFMRDPDLFVYLRESVVPQLVSDAAKRGNELRIWSAGCATGEEAYSLAILVCEVLGDALDDFTVRIFSTDLDSEAIAFARRGLYPAGAITGLPPELRERYFIEESGSVRVNKLIRGLTVFGVHDLAQRAPFPRIDMVLCRNVLIYFTSELQKRTLQLFAFSMRESGYLVLGRAETTSPFSELFTMHHPQQKIYQRSGGRVTIPAARLAASDSGPKQVSRERAAAAQAAGMNPAQRTSSRTRLARDSRAIDLPVGIVILSPRYDILEINPPARSLLDIHRPAIGEDLVHLVQSADTPRLRAALDAALRGETPPLVKAFSVATDGGPPHYLEILCQPQLRKDPGAAQPAEGPGQAPADGSPSRGKVDAVLVILRDTTTAVEEQLRLEATTTRSAAVEQELRTSVTRLETATASLWKDNNKLEASLQELSAALATEKEQRRSDSEALARYGDQIRELRAANEELVAANDRLQICNDEFILSNEEGQASTEEIETLNEEFQATNEELETLSEEFQATIEELNTTNEDLGARGKELLELAHSADAERVRLSAVLVGIGDGVLVVDPEGRVVLTNDAYGRMFEAPLQTILDEGGNAVDPEQMPHRRAARGESFRMEFSLPDKDAGPRDYEAIGEPIRDHNGQLGGVVVIRDISERSLRRLRDRFLAMTSHELRTPLVPLQGYLQMLLRSLSEDTPASDRLRYTSNAIAQVRRLSALVDELLDATRLQTGKLQLTYAPLDFGALVANVARSAESAARGHTLGAEIEPGPLMVRGDADRLEQVIVTLLSNAATHAPDADRIHVRARRVGDEAELEVEDHGPGIPESELSKLFWPFYQVSDVSQPSRGGLGLGLFICSEIITAHGGRITVRSTEGKGTVFTVRLKLLTDAPGTAESAQ